MTMPMQEISDRLEIQDLMVRYSYAIDNRDWDALDAVPPPGIFQTATASARMIATLRTFL